VIGILALGESAAGLKLVGTAMIVVGVVVLNLSSAGG
jgi:multidrug transporter EmrE-like cation transporter